MILPPVILDLAQRLERGRPVMMSWSAVPRIR